MLEIEKRFNSKMFLIFFILNFSLIAFSDLFILSMSNGNSENKFPWNMFIIMIMVSTPIILLQYPLLNLKQNWFYKTIIFYLSMIIFLFSYGTIQSIFEEHKVNFLDYFENGLKMILLGQIFGLTVFPGIVVVNWSVKKYTLNETK
ncbi:hypothetical protein C8C85_0157 [Flavobacterium sp. 103]|uniref:hypothetical protein n=1 Tax=Flavobacterium sp. 103 TaxID=2135624 RepID=UPI000D5F73F8|nr:hypothetical protein [Flavobacterium sp. 103]PVX44424.1 hypothetical protein C8C85_0157 [Flavobacterium sp. 103]